MTTDTAGVLDAIDAVLGDPTVSDDAMRSIPGAGRVICDGGHPLQLEDRPGWIDAGGTDQVIWVEVVPSLGPLAEFGAALSRGLAAALTITPGEVGLARLCEEHGKQGMDVLTLIAHDISALEQPRAHRRCEICNPAGCSGPALYVKPALRAKHRRHRQARRR